jgi:hypothetical protein
MEWPQKNAKTAQSLGLKAPNVKAWAEASPRALAQESPRKKIWRPEGAENHRIEPFKSDSLWLILTSVLSLAASFFIFVFLRK